MDASSIYLSRTSANLKKKSIIRIEADKIPKRPSRGKSFCHLSPSHDTVVLDPILKKKTPFTLIKENKPKLSSISKTRNDNSDLSEKSRQLTSKLIQSLTEKSSQASKFSIFSNIFIELADILPDFKDLLLTLRKGIAVSAIKERDLSCFEFSGCSNQGKSSLALALEKEQKEKQRLAGKLNSLSDEFILLKEKYEYMKKKYEEYEKIVKSDPNKFIEAKSLIEKMMNQCQVIQRQQNYIHELHHNESKLKKIIEVCQEKGIVLDEVYKSSFNSVLNPGVTKIYKKAKTFTSTTHSNLDEFM